MSDYNGWKNYETWSLFTVLSNDESIIDFFQNLKAKILAENDNKEEAIIKMRKYLEEQFKNVVESLTITSTEETIATKQGFLEAYEHILEAALKDVDYHELAETIINF